MGFTLGILGGMGPEATIELVKQIIKKTPAKMDQDHIPIIIFNNPKIPSRIDAILNGAESPLNMLQESAKVLENAGADYILIPCNTAHYWFQEIAESVNIPVYNMIRGTVSYVIQTYHSSKILLFATEATIKAGIYEKEFSSKGVDVIVPNTEEQKVINTAIKDVKTGLLYNNPKIAEINTILRKYKKENVTVVLAGCTELSLLLRYFDSEFIKVDPLDIAAEEAVRRAKEHGE